MILKELSPIRYGDLPADIRVEVIEWTSYLSGCFDRIGDCKSLIRKRLLGSRLPRILLDAKALWRTQTDLRQNVRLVTRDDYDVIDEYASLMKEGVKFPPVVINSSGYGGATGNFLVDGFHRAGAAVEAGKKGIEAIDIGELVIEFAEL